MNKNKLLLSTIFLICGFSLFSQNKVSENDLNINPFAKGKWQTYLTTPNLSFSRYNVEYNGADQGSLTNFNLNWGTHYFVRNGLGVGLELRANTNTYDNVNKQTNSRLMAYGNVMYGNRITNNMFYYVRAGAGIGRNSVKYTNPTNTNKDHYSTYGFKAEVGFPIRIVNNSHTYFTPELSYGCTRYNDNDRTQTDNRLMIGLRLESYLFCRQISCGCINGHSLAEHMYDGGRSFLGISTKGSINIGNMKTVYDNNAPDDKENYTNIRLKAEYMYYVTNNIALGASVNVKSKVEKDKTTDYKYTSLLYGLAPMIEYNLPFKNPSLKSFFIRGGIEFGGEKYETQVPGPGSNNTDKNTVISPCVGLGYNWFFADKLSLTVRYEYEWETIKNKENDDKQKENGSAFVIGIRRFF